MRKAIRNFLNKRGYEIIKQPYLGDKLPNLSKEKDIYYCETPTGNYYLPVNGLEKDPVSNTMVRGKYFDEPIIDIARKYIRKGTAVLDVGANFGQMSIEFSKLTGPEGKVYSFEAQDLVAGFTQKNLDANNCSNTELIRKAVWEIDDLTLYFSEPDFDFGGGYSGNALSDQAKKIPVKTVTIDSLNIQEPISFMKVDIEGADIFALRGARNTIMKNRMPVIFEFTQHVQDDFKTSFDDYATFVKSINYRFDEVVMGYNYLILPA